MDPIDRKPIIRQLKAEDADEISEIYALITKKSINAELRALVRTHAVCSEHEAPFVAEIEGKVVGFMISYILTLGFGAEKSAYIATMGVHPRYMGQGIGAGMAQEVFKFYRSQGVKRVYTSVQWDSTDILSFFKTLGFGRSDFINLKKELDRSREICRREEQCSC